MKIVKGSLWDSTDDLILVTCNSYIKKDGSLVMGRGAALEMKMKYPNIDKDFGNILSYKYDGVPEHLTYGVTLVCGFPYLNTQPELEMGIVSKKLFGVFQVKYHYKDDANLDLIRFSTEMLCGIFGKASMNFPGIGFGHLQYKDVLPIVEKLPDNVTLYMKD